MSWKGLIGQDKTVGFLKNAIKSGKVDRGFLLLGPEGSGKRFLSLRFAQALNCLKDDGMACLDCLSCRKIENSIHPDVHWVSTEPKATEIKIEQMRELIRQIYYKPFEGRRKVFVILEAEKMNEESANCLLKTLEEPPLNSVLVITASNLEALPSTVTSRCHVMKLSSPGLAEVERVLKEDFQVGPEEANFLARLSEGWIGRALQWRDKENLAGREKVFNDFCSGRIPLASLKDYEDKSYLENLLEILVTYYRDLLVFNITKNNSLLVNIDKEENIRKTAASGTAEAILEKLNFIMELKTAMRTAINRKLAVAYLASNLYK